MTNEQLYLAIGIPMAFNAVLVGLLIAYINARFTAVDTRFDDMREHLKTRFDDIKEMWRSELHRVEEILDARLKHLEERR